MYLSEYVVVFYRLKPRLARSPKKFPESEFFTTLLVTSVITITATIQNIFS